MYGLSDSLKPLSAAEEQVLLAVWSCKPPASRRDIGERLVEKGWKPATVLNFLYRLEAKGWVKSGKDQNRNIYTPTITKRAYSVWTPFSAGMSPPSAPSSARAAAPKASSNRPSPCSKKNTPRPRNMICMTPTAKPLSLASH